MHALQHRALPYANGSEPFRLKIAEIYLINYLLLDIRCLLLETNNSRMQNRASPPFLKEVAEVRSRRIREMSAGQRGFFIP